MPFCVLVHGDMSFVGYLSFAGTPAWKRFNKPKSLGRQAEATLEMIYSRTQWPSDDVIDSMWDLHRVRREKVRRPLC